MNKPQIERLFHLAAAGDFAAAEELRAQLDRVAPRRRTPALDAIYDAARKPYADDMNRRAEGGTFGFNELIVRSVAAGSEWVKIKLARQGTHGEEDTSDIVFFTREEAIMGMISDPNDPIAPITCSPAWPINVQDNPLAAAALCVLSLELSALWVAPNQTRTSEAIAFFMERLCFHRRVPASVFSTELERVERLVVSSRLSDRWRTRVSMHAQRVGAKR